MRSGTKHLRIASVIQILLGAGSAVATYFLIGAGDVTVAGLDPEKALGILAVSYTHLFPAFSSTETALSYCSPSNTSRVF